MNALGREIIQYTIIVILHINKAKTAREEIRLNSVLQILNQAQTIAQDDEKQGRRLFNMAKELAKLKSKGEV